MNNVLLLDADIVAYMVASRNQHDFDFGDTGSARVVDHNKAREDIDEIIGGYCDTLKASKVIICLSDPKVNFRKELNPTYKSNRKSVERPELLEWAKDYMAEEYQSFIRPRLEADDVMGILATSGDQFVSGNKIMVSEDKDMRTIPGQLYNPNQPQLGVIEISELEANQFHMWQTIVGDATDGYSGCPGIGTSGSYTEDDWSYGARGFGYPHAVLEADTEDLWDIVVEAYASKGFTEEDAILQARMAHILWASSYNFKKKTIRLWQPFWL